MNSAQVNIRYLTHPQVEIDPTKRVENWSLNALGAERVARLAESGALRGTSRIISSAEVKALETAQPLADALGVPVETRPKIHENDRSATGVLPPAEFEQVADQFFAHPSSSIRGWERAVDAQARILSEVDDALRGHDIGNVLFVGHGGVGTLLYCALAGLEISRKHDQGTGGGGNWFAFDLNARRPLSPWRPMEAWGTDF